MKVIIAGSRTISDYFTIDYAISQALQEWNISIRDIKEIVSGKGRGVDTIGEQWASQHSIPVVSFPAKWVAYGNAAGPIRNQQMAVYADALVAIWDGKSRGTADIIQRAKTRRLKVYVYNTTEAK